MSYDEERAAMNHRVFERIAASLDTESFINFFSPDGLANTTGYNECEDGHYVKWTTEKVRGGKYDGWYCAFLYAPIGKGARSGRGHASEWKRIKVSRCKTRREAKAMATQWYYEHSPKLAAKHGKVAK